MSRTRSVCLGGVQGVRQRMHPGLPERDEHTHGRAGIEEQFGAQDLSLTRGAYRHHHLGVHVWRANGFTGVQYRAAHGLLRSRGPTGQDHRRIIATNAGPRTPRTRARHRLDPARVTTGCHARKGAAAAEVPRTGKGPRQTSTRPSGRATVVICRWCGVQPFVNVHRRGFCSRSGASRHTRLEAGLLGFHGCWPRWVESWHCPRSCTQEA